MLDRLSGILLLTLIAFLPFEPAHDFFGLSALQWLFVALALTSLPAIWRRRRELVRNRVLVAAAVFGVVMLVSAALASPHVDNALKGFGRVFAGVALVAVARMSVDRNRLVGVWSVAATLAAGYALVDFAGFGIQGLFRSGEFYFGSVHRLSGSFEYPNVAAAYFALSLPLVWLSRSSWVWRSTSGTLLLSALILTFSRGAFVALLLGLGIGFLMARRGGWSSARIGWLGVAAILLYVVWSIPEPFLIERFGPAPSGSPVDASYEPRFNILRLPPGREYELGVRVTNKGQGVWPAEGSRRVVLAYHWYDVAQREVVPVVPTVTELPSTVAPGQSVELTARFTTPENTGLHLLDWDLRQEDFGWFSTSGVRPGIVEADLRRGVEPVWRLGDVSHWYPSGPEDEPVLNASVSRTDLWTAATTMFWDRPLLGVGPDNYRIMYGSYLGYARWNQNIRSNNMYLELLSTGGLLGLLSFLAVLGLARYTWRPAAIAVAVFLAHGFVDVFLMTTPIYFSFWILLGFADEDSV